MPIFNRWTILPCVSAQTCGLCIWELNTRFRCSHLHPAQQKFDGIFLCSVLHNSCTDPLSTVIVSCSALPLWLQNKCHVTKVWQHHFSKENASLPVYAAMIFLKLMVLVSVLSFSVCFPTHWLLIETQGREISLFDWYSFSFGVFFFQFLSISLVFRLGKKKKRKKEIDRNKLLEYKKQKTMWKKLIFTCHVFQFTVFHLKTIRPRFPWAKLWFLENSKCSLQSCCTLSTDTSLLPGSQSPGLIDRSSVMVLTLPCLKTRHYDRVVGMTERWEMLALREEMVVPKVIAMSSSCQTEVPTQSSQKAGKQCVL